MSDHSAPSGSTCSARFDPLRELFAAKLESGEDLGASLAINIVGEMAVDLWGWADEALTVPWAEDTITCVFSTTKTMTRLGTLFQLDYDGPTSSQSIPIVDRAVGRPRSDFVLRVSAARAIRPV